MVSALADAIGAEDYAQIIVVADELVTQDAEEACKVLWRAANDVSSMRRILAYFLVRRITGALAEASRLWLITTPATDATTYVNILSGLSVLAVEREGIPAFQFTGLPEFLQSALAHPERNVRISVLDFLRDYIDVEGAPRPLGRAAARLLAEQLQTHLDSVVQEEEIEELAVVAKVLRSKDIPEKPPVPIAAIEELVAQLESKSVDPELLTYVRVRRLRESARWQARHLHRPVITIRIFDPDHVVFEHLAHIFDLCRMEKGDTETTGEWIDAPAASISKHLKASEKTTRATLERFRRAVLIAADAGDPTALNEFPPRQAQALAALVMDASKRGIRAEFIFTEPDPAARQLTLEFHPPEEVSTKWLDVLASVRERGDREPEVYSEEVPQANTVVQVFEAVDATLKKGRVDIDDVSNISTTRQVDYYKQGARILGFLDASNQPTPLARDIKNKDSDARMRVAAKAFNDSMVGRAWRLWAGKEHLADVSVESAVEFLRARAVGISGTTIPRRASTLRKWQVELMPFYSRR
ncbi:MAG: hypothetical protein AB7O24_17920 [Kofleriaceae bacterium]